MTNSTQTNILAPELLSSVRTRLAHVESQLNVALPNIATELDYIYKTLKANPDIAYLLEDKEIGIFLQGQRQNLGIAIAAAKPKKAPAKAKPNLLDLLGD